MRFKHSLLAWTLLFGVGLAAVSSAWAYSDEEAGRIRGFLERGREFYRVKDYNSAVKSWVKVLEIDPLHEEALDLIDDAKFQIDYQVAVLDKVAEDRRLKKPFADELSKMAGEMTALLNRAEEEKRQREAAKPSTVSKQAAAAQLAEQQTAIRQAFERGMTLFAAGKTQEAFAVWDSILPQLPAGGELAQRIARIKEDSKKAESAKAAAAPAMTPAPAQQLPPAAPRLIQTVKPQPVQSKPLQMVASVEDLPAPTIVSPPASASASVAMPQPAARRLRGWEIFGIIMSGVVLFVVVGTLLFRRRVSRSKTPPSANRLPTLNAMGADPAEFNPKALSRLLEGKDRKAKPKERGLLD